MFCVSSPLNAFVYYGISNGIRITPNKGTVVGQEVAQICLLPPETPLDSSRLWL